MLYTTDRKSLFPPQDLYKWIGIPFCYGSPSHEEICKKVNSVKSMTSKASFQNLPANMRDRVAKAIIMGKLLFYSVPLMLTHPKRKEASKFLMKMIDHLATAITTFKSSMSHSTAHDMTNTGKQYQIISKILHKFAPRDLADAFYGFIRN